VSKMESVGTKCVSPEGANNFGNARTYSALLGDISVLSRKSACCHWIFKCSPRESSNIGKQLKQLLGIAHNYLTAQILTW
jgi:hypothetical protein